RSAMVDMPMGEEDLLNGDAMLLGGRLQAVEVTTRIDERTKLRLGAPQQGAILLQWRNRDDGGPKRWILRRIRHVGRLGSRRQLVERRGHVLHRGRHCFGTAH